MSFLLSASAAFVVRRAVRDHHAANGVQTLILCGIATSGVVLSTIRYATDADYDLVVVADCCSDADPEIHRVLVEKVFARPATVTTAEAVIGAFASSGSKS